MSEAEVMLENTHRLTALVMTAAAERDAAWRARAAQGAAGAAARPAPPRDAMYGAEQAADQAWRTFEPLTRTHLDRLADLAARDHEAFTRPAGHPEFRQRRLLAVLAQGAARHYLDCLAGHEPGLRAGVKDLDVWTFYAAIPGTTFPAARRETHADFGVSSLGRQSYDLAGVRTDRERALWRRWAAYQGRRGDFLMRALPVAPDAPYAEIVRAVQDWLRRGAAASHRRKPSSWHLAQKAMIALSPASQRGQILWPADTGCQAGPPLLIPGR